jgi:N-acetylmuramoyl-L-alanine amidase
MIKPIFNNRRFTASELLHAQRESEKNDDEDVFLDIPFTNEICPIGTDEQELREYIRNAEIKRKITSLVVHCTASRQNASIDGILAHWKRKGWKNPGYHIILPMEGFTILSDFNNVTNGAIGHNYNGVHISYIGGVEFVGKKWKPLDNRTESQKRLIDVFIVEMVKRFPEIKVIGHNEVAKKACPSFKVKNEYPEHWTGI